MTGALPSLEELRAEADVQEAGTAALLKWQVLIHAARDLEPALAKVVLGALGTVVTAYGGPLAPVALVLVQNAVEALVEA